SPLRANVTDGLDESENRKLLFGLPVSGSRKSCGPPFEIPVPLNPHPAVLPASKETQLRPPSTLNRPLITPVSSPVIGLRLWAAATVTILFGLVGSTASPAWNPVMSARVSSTLTAGTVVAGLAGTTRSSNASSPSLIFLRTGASADFGRRVRFTHRRK